VRCRGQLRKRRTLDRRGLHAWGTGNLVAESDAGHQAAFIIVRGVAHPSDKRLEVIVLGSQLQLLVEIAVATRLKAEGENIIRLFGEESKGLNGGAETDGERHGKGFVLIANLA